MATNDGIMAKVDEAMATCPTDPNQLDGAEAIALAKTVLRAVLDYRYTIDWKNTEAVASLLNITLNMVDIAEVV